MQDGIESNRTFEELYPTIVELCVLALDASYGNGQYMCPGIIKAYGPVVSHYTVVFVFIKNLTV